jgi:hypothetical protein
MIDWNAIQWENKQTFDSIIIQMNDSLVVK